jgi:hypothetical protein
MRLNGATVQEIADVYNRTVAAVVTRLGKLRVRVTPESRPWTPEEDAQLLDLRIRCVKAYTIARKLNRTERSVSRRVEYLRLPPMREDAWPRGQLQKAVARLHSKGLTDRQMAEQLNTHPACVSGARVRLKLPSNTTLGDAGRRGGEVRRAKALAACEARGCFRTDLPGPKPPCRSCRHRKWRLDHPLGSVTGVRVASD